VLGRWSVQKGCVYIPKSVKLERMRENSQVFDFELSDAEMARLDGLTTDAAVAAFALLYRTCVNRDTPLAGTLEGVKMDITEG
jgi:diketogulonate reductase-like aldo/keto reductase